MPRIAVSSFPRSGVGTREGKSMKKKTETIKININGVDYEEDVPSDIRLLEYLRTYRQLTGAKKACNAGECGSCTVLLDGRAVYSCITLAVQAHGKRVETIEALGDEENLHRFSRLTWMQERYSVVFVSPG